MFTRRRASRSSKKDGGSGSGDGSGKGGATAPITGSSSLSASPAYLPPQDEFWDNNNAERRGGVRMQISPATATRSLRCKYEEEVA